MLLSIDPMGLIRPRCDLIARSKFSNTESLTDNIASFLRTLGKSEIYS